MLQEGIALGTLKDHIRGPQCPPQGPGTGQVPAERRLAGDVEAGAEASLPCGQQWDLQRKGGRHGSDPSNILPTP